MLCDLRIAELEKEREQHRVVLDKEDDLLLCRTRHICQMGEGERTFSSAFEERFLIRDVAMMADHNKFMAFDINDESDAMVKLESFAKYVISPLNPVLQERKQRMEFLKLTVNTEDNKSSEDSARLRSTSQNGS